MMRKKIDRLIPWLLYATLGFPCLASASPAEPVEAADDSVWTRGQLTGEWFGARPALAEHGLTFNLFYTAIDQGTIFGTGDNDFEFGDRFDALIDLDFGKLGLWKGGSLHSHLEYSSGNAPAWHGGALLPVNTAMALPLGGSQTLVASSLYFKQRFSDSASLMVGKFNVVDFLASDPFYGGWGVVRFMNVAFVAPLSGLLPPTIMGGILNYRTDPIAWTLMVYDPNDQTTNYSFDGLFSDGVNVSLAGTWDGEWAGRPSSVNVNGIYSTKEKADLSDFLLPPDLQTKSEDGSWFLSIKLTHLLLESAAASGKGLGLYVKAGLSDGNPDPIQSFVTGGLAGHGMVTGRPLDVFGIGYFYYNFSDDLQSATAPVTNFDDEQGAEVFYNLAGTPWLHVSADLQWIDPASGDSDDFWLGGLRIRVVF